MGYAHNQIAKQVGSALLVSKEQIVEAGASTLETVAAMMRAGFRAKVAPETAATILDRARSLSNNMLAANQDVYALHAQLAVIRADWQVPPGMFGPNDTEPDRAFPSPMSLHAVADAA